MKMIPTKKMKVMQNYKIEKIVVKKRKICSSILCWLRIRVKLKSQMMG